MNLLKSPNAAVDELFLQLLQLRHVFFLDLGNARAKLLLFADVSRQVNLWPLQGLPPRK